VEEKARADWLLAEARRRDPERTLCALFAPAGRRERLLALLVLNQELARLPAEVSQPMAGMIRCQWWRDAIASGEGETPGHPVVEALGPALADGSLPRRELEALIDAREADLAAAPIVDLDGLEDWARGRSGLLQQLCARVSGSTEAAWLEAAAKVGTAFALLGALQGRTAGQGGEQRIPDERLIDRAQTLIAETRALGRIPAAARPALLPALYVRDEAATLASGDAKAPRNATLMPLRLWWAALRGRI
jgi:phytoene/squalene synthetase